MALNDYNDFLDFPLGRAAGRRVIESEGASPRSEALPGPESLAFSATWRFSRDADLQGLIAEFTAVGYTRPIAWTPPGNSAGMYIFREIQFTTRRDSPRYVITATLDRQNGA